MLEKIRNILESIQGFENKVAYRSFPKGEAPALPFICFLETGPNIVFADNTVYYSVSAFDIELYSRYRDPASEKLVEEKLKENNITWDKDIEYIDDQKCYEVIYTVEV